MVHLTWFETYWNILCILFHSLSC